MALEQLLAERGEEEWSWPWWVEQMQPLNVLGSKLYGRIGSVGRLEALVFYSNRALGSTFAQNISVAGGGLSYYDKQEFWSKRFLMETSVDRVFYFKLNWKDVDQAYKDMDDRKTIKSMIGDGLAQWILMGETLYWDFYVGLLVISVLSQSQSSSPWLNAGGELPY